MKKIAVFVILLLMVAISSSCVSNRSVKLFQQRKGIPTYDSVGVYEPYRLKNIDKINVYVSSLNPEISTLFNHGSSGTGHSYEIYADGTIDIPFADSVPVVGLTLLEAKMAIEERLKYVDDHISVNVSLATNCFYMMGKSGRGTFNITHERMNIYQAMAVAGFSPGMGRLGHVQVIRMNQDGTFNIREFDLRTASLVGSEYYYVYPNDIYYIGSIRGVFFRINSFSSFSGVISSSVGFFNSAMTYVTLMRNQFIKK